jgi:hypothetical protein
VFRHHCSMSFDENEQTTVRNEDSLQLDAGDFNCAFRRNSW